MIGMRTKMLAAATLVGGTMALTVGGGLMGQQITKPASVTVPSTAAAALAVQPPVAQSGAASAAPRLATAPASSGWEYKIVNQDINAINEESLNQLGKDGWEFCTTLSGNPGRILFKRSRTKSALASIGALDMNAPNGMGPGMTMGAGMPGGMGGGLPGGVPGMPGGGGPGLPGGVPGMPGGGGPGLPGGVPGMPGGGIVQSIPPASSAVPSGASGKTRVQTPDPRSRTGGPGAPATASMPSSRDRNTHEEVDPEETAIIPLKHAQANDIMSTLVQLYTSGLPGMGQRFVSDHPKFAVDMRTNSLLLIGRTRQLDKIRELIKALDVEAKEPKGPTRSRIDNN